MALTAGAGDGRTLEGAVLRVALVLLAVGLVAALAWALRSHLILILLALIVAAGMYGPVAALERRGLPRTVAVVLVLAAVLGAIALALIVALPPLVTQAIELTQELPSRIGAIRDQLATWIDSIAGSGTANRMFQSLGEYTPDLSNVWQLPLSALGVIADIVFIVFIGVLMLIERDRARDYALRFVPPERRAAMLELLRALLGKLGSYVRAQLLLMAVSGVGTAIGMVILGVPFPLPMALLSFITAAIPLVGPWIAGVPITLLAFAESPLTGVLMGAWMIAYQQVEGFLLVPAIQGKVLNLSPLVVLLAVLAGASLYGIVGAILAVPLVALAHVLTELVIAPQFRARYRRNTKGSSP